MYSKLQMLLLILFALPVAGAQTTVAIQGPEFTLNGHPTYTAAGGFSSADPNIQGTLLNIRAVQAIFDDANYPNGGSRLHPYASPQMGTVSFDYPNAPYGTDRNLTEFLAALPTWRRTGLLAFTVNLQGGGPNDGNFGTHGGNQPQWNSGFDPRGNLKPAYAARLRRIIEEADRLGLVVIVGYFYQGSEQRVDIAADDIYAREAIRQASLFLKGLPHRNILIEIANEISPGFYKHPILTPEGVVEAVKLAQETVQHQIPVSLSWLGAVPPSGTPQRAALDTVDYVMFHTNNESPEKVHTHIQAMRDAFGSKRPLLINEDGVSAFNLKAAVDERVGWGYYDQGLNNYRDGFQSPPVNWNIRSIAKWVFFDQVARLTGSPSPPRPAVADDSSPLIDVKGLRAGQTLKQPVRIEAIVHDRDPHWPIKRVEFFIDNKPYSYSRSAPFLLGNQSTWSPADVSAGKHTFRVVAYDQRGPSFSEIGSIFELHFITAP